MCPVDLHTFAEYAVLASQLRYVIHREVPYELENSVFEWFIERDEIQYICTIVGFSAR
jgi:predicted ATP-grasp superfamily ATP-dependent carboligase